MPKPVARPRYNKPENKKWEANKYAPQRKFCAFCADKVAVVDYKDAAKLRRYISDRGKIEPRRRTGTCAKHQRAVADAIKRARHLALLPFVPAHMRRASVPVAVAAPAAAQQAPAANVPAAAITAPTAPATTAPAVQSAPQPPAPAPETPKASA